jgi:Fe(3+) dicitrate transport protein
MISKAFKIAILLLVSVNAYSQYRLSGYVFSDEDSTTVTECTVHLNDGKRAAFVTESGKFIFNDLANGNYVLHFTSTDFQYLQANAVISNGDVQVTIYMKPRREILSELMISDAGGNFGFTKLRAVEGMGIYESKKSEVIIPEQLVANVSTNNARQVYARVAGLNIWENDGGGLQLSIGGRGLDPNRTANFNTRQNGYDISADALGYPESYYTPPVEGIGKIQIVRGAASLQYGTQFGGLINFQMKTPVRDRKLEFIARQTGGSFGFYNAFTSASGTAGKISYYTFFQYKRGDGWRKNSHFDSYTAFANVNYQITEKTKIGIDYTLQDYLAQQPGGLTDLMFTENPRQTNRERNWFKVNWNLFALHIDHKFNASTEFNVRIFGLDANRYSVGFRPARPSILEDPENYEYRDLITGDFNNWGAEARFLTRYRIRNMAAVLLVGARYYDGFNHSRQGDGTNGRDADFTFVNEDTSNSSDYRFPNKNTAFFAEHIFFVSDKFSITPGLRFEHISTTAKGFHQFVPRDNAGNILEIRRTDEDRDNSRNIFLAGIGASYKPMETMDIYFNFSQNYRSITFNDMQIKNPSSKIDPNLKDEKGYSIDFGVRNEGQENFNYDLSVFYLNYNNRIGETNEYDEFNNIFKYRTNVGQALIAGIEAYAESDFLRLTRPDIKSWSTVLFGNFAFIKSKYNKSALDDIEGRDVEFVPVVNLKSGIRVGYKKLKGSLQYSYLSKQFSDARNNQDVDQTAVFGVIPSYYVMDFSLSYEFKKFRVEGSINNLSDNMYFTRRATGYPGPGIIPSDGRSFFLTLQVRL